MLSLVLRKLKLWGYVIGAGLVMALYVALKVVRGQLEDARYEAKKYKHQIKRKAETEAREVEIDSTWSDRERNTHENIDDIPPFLRNRRMHDDTD